MPFDRTSSPLTAAAPRIGCGGRGPVASSPPQQDGESSMTPNAETDQLLFQALTTALFTAVVGDVLDTLGFRNQFLPAALVPLTPGTKLAGRAMPVVEADIAPDGTIAAAPQLAQKPFGLMLE